MIGLPAGTKIWLAAGITDMRAGMNGLAAKVGTALAEDPYCGHVFVFRGRRGDMLKVLWWSGDGLCLLAKCLERGRFVWPQAPGPSPPIERGIAGPGLLAHVLVAKFADHLPLYRQSLIYAREGVHLDRALLASWVGAASALLRPLVEATRKHVLAAAKLHADDTPVPVLARKKEWA